MLSASDIAYITATQLGSFDTTITINRDAAPGTDAYGHQTLNPSSQGTALVNTYRPSATQLQSFAGKIGSQQALMLRFATTTDIREGDTIVLNSLNWLVQNVQKAESYTYVYDALITVIS